MTTTRTFAPFTPVTLTFVGYEDRTWTETGFVKFVNPDGTIRVHVGAMDKTFDARLDANDDLIVQFA